MTELELELELQLQLTVRAMRSNGSCDSTRRHQMVAMVFLRIYVHAESRCNVAGISQTILSMLRLKA